MTDDEQRQLDIIGYNLSRLLKQNGATQRELASAIGVSESAVGKWVLAKNAPTMGSVQKMANYFGVRMSDILERKSPNTNDISEHIKRTVATMRQMTASGQARVADYADDLHASGKYDRPAIVEDDQHIYTLGRAAAGSGYGNIDPVQTHRIIHTTEIPDHDFTLDVTGESMSPTISDSDIAPPHTSMVSDLSAMLICTS